MTAEVHIGARLPEDSLSSAAFGLGLDQATTPRSGVIRAALALFHGRDRNDAKQLAKPARKSRLGSDGTERVTARVDAELADTGEVPLSYAIRVGLAMAAGLDRKQAENWAAMMHPGRPSKQSTMT